MSYYTPDSREYRVLPYHENVSYIQSNRRCIDNVKLSPILRTVPIIISYINKSVLQYTTAYNGCVRVL